MKKFLVMWMVFWMVAMAAWAKPELRRLPWQTAAQYGATHVIEVDYTDLIGYTATNTTVILTNVVNAPCSVEFRGMVLDKAFDSTSKTNALSMTMSAGIVGTLTKWINGKQVAYDGTEIVNSFGTDYTVATATTTTGPATNALVSTSTSTVTSPRLNEQASDVSLTVSFGPCLANFGHSILGSGRVRLFYRILQ